MYSKSKTLKEKRMPVGSISNSDGMGGMDAVQNYPESSPSSVAGANQPNQATIQEAAAILDQLVNGSSSSMTGGAGQVGAGPWSDGAGDGSQGYGGFPGAGGASEGADPQQALQMVQTLLNDLTGGQGMPGAGMAGPGNGIPSGGPSGVGGGGQEGSAAGLTNSYNNVMNLISSNGSSPTDITNAINQFEAAGGSQFPNVQNAMNNIKASVADGTYSQQASQGALEGAAQRDGIQGVSNPQIDGNAGMANQDAGWYDSGSNAAQNYFKNPSVGGNSTILANEINGGAPPSQIKNNALALAQEAQNAGMTNVANAARNVANSINDGSYNAQASSQALGSAINTDNLKPGVNPVNWDSN
jgi:hypothetical protein